MPFLQVVQESEEPFTSFRVMPNSYCSASRVVMQVLKQFLKHPTIAIHVLATAFMCTHVYL